MTALARKGAATTGCPPGAATAALGTAQASQLLMTATVREQIVFLACGRHSAATGRAACAPTGANQSQDVCLAPLIQPCSDTADALRQP